MVELTDTDRHTLARWRLVLGKSAEQHGISCAGDSEVERVEHLVGFLFGDGESGEGARGVGEGKGAGGGYGGGKSKKRQGGRESSRMTVPEWVDQVSELFPHSAKEVLERELIQRRGINELLQEPKLLEKIEPNVELVKTLLTHKHLLNPEARILARKLIDRTVNEIKDKLRLQIEQAINGAIRRDRHSSFCQMLCSDVFRRPLFLV